MKYDRTNKLSNNINVIVNVNSIVENAIQSKTRIMVSMWLQQRQWQCEKYTIRRYQEILEFQDIVIKKIIQGNS